MIVVHGSILLCWRLTLHRTDDLRTLGARPPGISVLTSDIEGTNEVSGTNFEDEKGIPTETVLGAKNNQIAGLDVLHCLIL